jgi:cytochrome P450
MDIDNSSDPQELLRLARTPAGKREANRVYARIRSLTPLWRDPDSGFWFVFGWEDCNGLLRSSQFTAAHKFELHPRFSRSASLQFLSSSLPSLDPPAHTRVRSIARGSFSAPVLKKHESHISTVIDAAIQNIRDRPSFDVVEDYATVVTRTAIWELLGIPPSDHARLGCWLGEQFKLLSLPQPTEAEMDRIDAAAQSMLDYFSDLIEKRRREPGADIVSSLLSASGNSADTLTLREMTVTVAILLGGASDTTKTAISSGIRLLLAHPDQLRRLLADRSLEMPAFEEILRIGGSVVLGNLRKTAAEVEIAGERIAAGQLVFPVLAAANHDPAKFDDPHRFDIARTPNPHLAFGAGIHACIGNLLARTVGVRAVAALIRAFPTMELLEDGCEANASLVTLRSWNKVPVAVSNT